MMRVVRWSAFAVACVVPLLAHARSFPDVFPNHPHASAIEFLSSEGIMRGYGDGFFRPERVLTRAEMTKVIVELTVSPAKIVSCPLHALAFNDVPPSAWYAPPVCAARAAGIIQGYADGRFLPTRPVTFSEAAKIIVTAYRLPLVPTELGGLERGAVERLASIRVIPLTISSLSDTVTRAEFAEIIYRLENGITSRPSHTWRTLTGGFKSDDFTRPGRGLQLDIEADETRVDEGDTVILRITVRNRTTTNQRVDIEVVHDRDLEFRSASHGGDEKSGARVEWDNVRVAEDDEEKLTLRLRVRSGAREGDRFTVRTSGADEDGNRDSVSETIHVEDEDDDDDDGDEDEELDLRVTADNDRPRKGEVVEYRIRVDNNSSDSQSVDIRTEFDSDLVFVSGSNNVQIVDGNTVEWRNIRVHEDETEFVRLQLKIRDAARAGDRLDVEAFAEDDDRNRDREIETVRVAGGGTTDGRNINVEATVSDRNPPVGALITYTFDLRNSGTVGTSVDLVARFDRDIVFLSASDGGTPTTSTRAEWRGLFVPAGQSRIVTLRAAVRPDADGEEELELEVTATDAAGDADGDTVSIEVEERDDDDDDDDDDGNDNLSVELTADEDEVSEDDTVEFRIRIENESGDDEDVDVEVSFDEDEFTFVSASDGGDDENNGRITWDNVFVEEDEEETLRFELRVRHSVSEGDDLEVRVEVEGEDGDDDDDEETVEVEE